MGNSTSKKVHGPGYVERHPFHVALEAKHRRYALVGGDRAGGKQHKLYYARLWGGEYRERREEEKAPSNLVKLVFLQGLGGTSVTWSPQLEFFSGCPQYDILAVDMRGVGFSDTPSGRWRTSEMATDVNELLEQVHWTDGKVHCIAFSLGGMVAIEAACLRPDLYRSMSLISTHAGGLVGTMLPPWGISPFLRTFTNLESADAVDAGIELLFPKSFLDSDIEQDVHHQSELFQKTLSKVMGSNERVTNRLHIAWQMIHQARKYVEAGTQPIRVEGTLKQMSAALTHYVSWERLLFLKVSGIRFLVVAGKQDNLVNYLNAKLLADALGAHESILKDDAGHGVNLQFTQEINQALMRTITCGESKKLVEGRRRPTKHDGFAPTRHPFTTCLWLVLPCYLAARRASSLTWRRNVLTIGLLSALVRLIYGRLF